MCHRREHSGGHRDGTARKPQSPACTIPFSNQRVGGGLNEPCHRRSRTTAGQGWRSSSGILPVPRNGFGPPPLAYLLDSLFLPPPRRLVVESVERVVEEIALGPTDRMEFSRPFLARHPTITNPVLALAGVETLVADLLLGRARGGEMVACRKRPGLRSLLCLQFVSDLRMAYRTLDVPSALLDVMLAVLLGALFSVRSGRRKGRGQRG